MFLAPSHQRNPRLQSHKRSRSSRPSTSSINVEAILFKSVPVPEEDLEDLEEWCKPALATSARQATVNHLVDPPRWGNPQGLSTLEKIDNLTASVKRLEEKTAETEHMKAEIEAEIEDLKTKVNIMAAESSAYLAVRNRFFSTYCRDIIGTIASKDRDVVPLGNKKAHGGDIITDKKLYSNGTRYDDATFEALYGIHWSRVHLIEHDPASINALNAHATAVANKDYLREHLIPLNTAFNKLIRLMEEHRFRSFANLPNAPETIALAEYNKECHVLINRYRSGFAAQ